MYRPTLRAFALGSFVAALAGAPAFADESDEDFVEMAASGGMMEVELGRHASQHAADPSVRQFGQRMVMDHGKANQELKSVAERQGLRVPAEMQEKHREMVEKLTKLRGGELDRAYMEAMVEDHEEDVEKFREQAEEPESEVDRWAAKTVPTLEAHLQQARSIHQTVSAQGSGRGGVGAGPPDEPGETYERDDPSDAGRP